LSEEISGGFQEVEVYRVTSSPSRATSVSSRSVIIREARAAGAPNEF
jgi:hypothetical protein